MPTIKAPSVRTVPHRPIRLVPDADVRRLPRRGVDTAETRVATPADDATDTSS